MSRCAGAHCQSDFVCAVNLIALEVSQGLTASLEGRAAQPENDSNKVRHIMKTKHLRSSTHVDCVSESVTCMSVASDVCK